MGQRGWSVLLVGRLVGVGGGGWRPVGSGAWAWGVQQAQRQLHLPRSMGLRCSGLCGMSPAGGLSQGVVW